jgi:hypothetical protein
LNQRERKPQPARNNRGPIQSFQTANSSYWRYLELAREAASRGDKIEAENYLQHAEHFLRLMRACSA